MVSLPKHSLIVPGRKWERFGCEDPRITKIGDAFSSSIPRSQLFPVLCRWDPASSRALGSNISMNGIRSRPSMQSHGPLPENRWQILCTPHARHRYATGQDRPGLFFENQRHVESARWKRWHDSLEKHTSKLSQNDDDQVEFGAPPQDQRRAGLSSTPISVITGAVPLVHRRGGPARPQNPSRIIGRTTAPLFVPEEYELYGKVPDVVFPTRCDHRPRYHHVLLRCRRYDYLCRHR